MKKLIDIDFAICKKAAAPTAENTVSAGEKIVKTLDNNLFGCIILIKNKFR